MKRLMKKIFQLTSILAVLSVLVLSCAKETLSTDQYDSEKVLLQAYGPQPVVRGGLLRFVGSNLDKVATVTIPGVDPIVPEVITSGTHSEIRIVVPKDGPYPGYPVLTLADGTTITAKTQISYSEPISIESFAPASLFPNEVLTIKGDYLNLIHEIVFNNKVIVSEDYFTAHTRYEIKVLVPEEAQTGKFALGTLDETKLNPDDDTDKALLASLNLIESETPLEVGTATATFPAAAIKSGSKVNISGDHLRLVESIKFDSVEESEFTATNTELTFNLPLTAPDGVVMLVMASGVEVPIGTLTTVVPSEVELNPQPVKNGEVLTIKGKDLDIVDNIVVGGAPLSDFSRNSDKTEISFTVPDAAVEGDIVFIMVNRKESSVPFTLVKPTVTAYSANPVAAGSDLEITGTDLDLVASVTFGVTEESEGLPVTEGLVITETAITVPVPTAAETGILVLNLINGTTVECDELAIDKPAGAYIASFPTEQYPKGAMFIVDIENPDHLTGVQIDGEEVNYILNGSTLYFAIPNFAKANSQLTLVSDNGSVTYTMNIDPGDFIVTPIWTGSKNIDWGGTYGEDGKSLATLAYGGFDWSTVKEGTILRIEYEPTVPEGEWYCIALRHGDGWGNLPDQPGQFDNPANPFDFELTQEILDDLVASSGLIISGQNYKITQVSLVEDLRYGDTLWKGELVLDAWGIGNQSLAWGGYDWSTVPAGSTFFIFAEPIVEEGEWWCIQPRHGTSWGTLPASAPAQFDNPESPASFVLTQEVLDDLVANNGMVVTGYGCKITKLCLKK